MIIKLALRQLEFVEGGSYKNTRHYEGKGVDIVVPDFFLDFNALGSKKSSVRLSF